MQYQHYLFLGSVAVHLFLKDTIYNPATGTMNFRAGLQVQQAGQAAVQESSTAASKS
ncbi:MAG: hypothetical protein IRF12RH_02930 [Rickettsia helvetica]|uniref:Uncharacterized protein n=1 Tax=Rickettsia helvetica TaxID=35789 RepID=A0ABP0T4F7_RICHE